MMTYGISDPSNVNLDTTSARDIVCYITRASNEYNKHVGSYLSTVVVIFITSTVATVFPVLATRTRFKVPLYLYLFSRYFGAGVIIATAFIQFVNPRNSFPNVFDVLTAHNSLLDPAYGEIGPQTCVGMTDGWSQYSWPPALALISSVSVFLIDFAAERYVEKRYRPETSRDIVEYGTTNADHAQDEQLSEDRDDFAQANYPLLKSAAIRETDELSMTSFQMEREFQQQIAAFLILEFGVLFHSIIIGLTLGTAGVEFASLYPVIVFHQAFEGLGIGARLSTIPFPKRLHWLPWFLCLCYGLSTPTTLGISLGVRTTFNADGFLSNVVSGVLDAVSAGILLYTGFVELLARDFLFNTHRTQSDSQLAFMLCSLLLGAALMALLGKWA